MRHIGPTANRGFARFNRWFTSRAGVYQTVGVCAILVGLESTGVLHDPQGFYMLYWLTVYSAITQPALAASGRSNEEITSAYLRRLDQKEEIDVTLLTKIVGLLEAQEGPHAAR